MVAGWKWLWFMQKSSFKEIIKLLREIKKLLEEIKNKE